MQYTRWAVNTQLQLKNNTNNLVSFPLRVILLRSQRFDRNIQASLSVGERQWWKKAVTCSNSLVHWLVTSLLIDLTRGIGFGKPHPPKSKFEHFVLFMPTIARSICTTFARIMSGHESVAFMMSLMRTKSAGMLCLYAWPVMPDRWYD